MNKDWKGANVKIVISHSGTLVRVIKTSLDTDTLIDLFTLYSPSEGYRYKINPEEPIYSDTWL